MKTDMWNATPKSLMPFLLLPLVACKSAPFHLPRTLVPASSKPAIVGAPASNAASDATATRIDAMPPPPEFIPEKPAPSVPKPLSRPASVRANLNFEQVPLPTLIQLVYSEILKLPVSVDPKVLERRDLVTVRTPPNQSAAEIERVMNMLLKSYGLAAIEVGGMVRVVPESAQLGYLPEIQRGSALPETPRLLRPQFQLVELAAVRNIDVVGWIKILFGDRVQAMEDSGRNAILLSGSSENVRAALEAIHVLDQPAMHGRSAMRITPSFWSAGDLAHKLAEVLAAEGYSMPPASFSMLSGGVRYPILLLPIEQVNALLVFSSSAEVMEHVQGWVEKLDQPGGRGIGKSFYTYKVKNTSAATLATTVDKLLQGSGGGAAGTSTAPAAPGTSPGGAVAATDSARSSPNAGRVVVDKGTNTLLFQTTNEEYSQLVPLLRTLDQSAKSVLVEVTIAEVNLTDNTELGVEWILKVSGLDIATLGGTGIGKAGVVISNLNSSSDARMVINALASSNQAKILSTPSVVARNGEEASIQVGQEVPILASQLGSASTTTGAGNSPNILSTVQYRDTGVILKIKPTIHSEDKVDIEIDQEVSNAVATTTGVSNSPTISTRKLNTKMTLKTGSTVLLGGLMSTNDTGGNTGIPWLKDIPWLGILFGKQTMDARKTELLVLLTPYIMNDNDEAEAIYHAFKSRMPAFSETGHMEKRP